jgi:hypothetical protein
VVFPQIFHVAFEVRSRSRLAPEIRNLDFAVGRANHCRRIAAVVVASRIENFHCLLRNQLGEIGTLKRLCLIHAGWFFRAITTLIGND